MVGFMDSHSANTNDMVIGFFFLHFGVFITTFIPFILSLLAAANVKSSFAAKEDDEERGQLSPGQASQATSGSDLKSESFLDGFDAESDAYKLLFDQIFSKSDKVDLLKLCNKLWFPSFGIGFQIFSLIFLFLHFNSDKGWDPILVKRGGMVARQFAAYVLAFAIRKEFVRNGTLMEIAIRVQCNACGQLCAWLLAMVAWTTTAATYAVGYYMILHSKDLQDVFMRFVALLIIMEMDDWMGAGAPVKGPNGLCQQVKRHLGEPNKCLGYVTPILNTIFALVVLFCVVIRIPAFVASDGTD